MNYDGMYHSVTLLCGYGTATENLDGSSKSNSNGPSFVGFVYPMMDLDRFRIRVLYVPPYTGELTSAIDAKKVLRTLGGGSRNMNVNEACFLDQKTEICQRMAT
jgi:hypothetical protein